MDYGALTPEINSGLIYAGPGAGPMLAAAAAWDGLAAELGAAASSYGTVIEGLVSGPWLGPSSMAMAGAVAPYVTWMATTAGQAQVTGAQALAAAGAFETAFAASVPPPVIAANRALLADLVATNFFGVNTPAIMATEAHYLEMWAQDAAAMYAYAASAAVATASTTPFTPAPQTTNSDGLIAQGAASVQTAAGSASQTVQSVLSRLTSMVSPALSSLASPGASTSPTSGLSELLSGLLGSSSGSAIPGLGSSSSLLENYATLPAWFGMTVGTDVIGNLISNALTPAAADTAAADEAAAAADGAAAAADLGEAAAADLGGAAAADLGGMAGAVGGLTVPQTWGWAASGLPPMLGSVSLAAPMATGESALGAGLGFPFMFPPGGALGRTAAAGATGAVAGAAVAKYLPRMKVAAGSPEAGYAAAETKTPAANQKFPVPAAFPTNGHAPPGYQAAVVYLPVNGHASEKADA